MNKVKILVKYIIAFIMLLILNLGTFLYQDVILMKVDTLVEMIISILFYFVFYSCFGGIFWLLRKKMTNNFIKYNLIFPWTFILIVILFKIFTLNRLANIDEIKPYDALNILFYIALIFYIKFNTQKNLKEDKTFD